MIRLILSLNGVFLMLIELVMLWVIRWLAW